jgi:hypothetical protein
MSLYIQTLLRLHDVMLSQIQEQIYFLPEFDLPAALGPGVYSASNRNEYQKHKNNVSGE